MIILVSLMGTIGTIGTIVGKLGTLCFSTSSVVRVLLCNLPQVAFVNGLVNDTSHQISIGVGWHQ